MSNAAMGMGRTLTESDVARLTDRIETAQHSASAIPKLTEDYPGMTLGDGYAVQLALLRRWLAKGQRQVGWKAGLTSKAKMDQMGVRVPTIGFLMADMFRGMFEQATKPVNVASATALNPNLKCFISFFLVFDVICQAILFQYCYIVMTSCFSFTTQLARNQLPITSLSGLR